LCPVYKKGDKLDCKNYRRIFLLNVTYKVFAKMLHDHLLPHAAVEHHNASSLQFFIDFKAVYDIIIRSEVYVGMSELNFPTKLIGLTKTTLTIIMCCIKIQNDCSESFETRQGLRQRNVLSTLLFNFQCRAESKPTNNRQNLQQ
jgi:hypothetical protein